MTQTTRITHWEQVPVDFSQVPAIEEADIQDFEKYTLERDAGRLAEDDFRRIRLMNGIYGIRGEERLHMVRIKSPGGILNASRLRMLGRISTEYSRGFGHITTRQNFQFHMVRVEDVPQVMRMIASAGLTTREACGDTFRTIQADPLAGLIADHAFDVTPWAQAATDHFLRNPITQRLPRKFKVNFSGNADDLGQTAINCVGPVATKHPESGELGFRVYVGGGLGTTPFEAKLLEDFTSMEWLIPTMEAIVRIFNVEGNRENRNRARLKWLLANMGIKTFREKVFAERQAVLAASGTNTGIPTRVLDAGAHLPIKVQATTPLPAPTGNERFDKWVSTNLISTVDGKFAAYATIPLGDVTTEQFFGLAGLLEDFGSPLETEPNIRITNRQNILFRAISPDKIEKFYNRLNEVGFGNSNVHSASDPVSCPGADTCKIAVTQSRGLAKAIRAKLQEEDLTEAPVRINISGCSNSCGQHHLADIGFFGFERRHRTESTSLPGYQMLIGGGLGDEGARFGKKIGKPIAKMAPQATADTIRMYDKERTAGESFRDWVDRTGTSKIKDALQQYDNLPSQEANSDAYIDWDETTKFQVEVGESECN